MDRILCDELLEEVLRRLPTRSTFSRSTADVSLVSKRWLRLYRSSVSDVSLSLAVDNCTPPSLSSFLSHFPHLSFLKITTLAYRIDGCQLLSHDDISDPPLRRLVLSQADRHVSFHWLVFLHSLRKLAVIFYPVRVKFNPVDRAASKANFDDGELKLETLSLSGLQHYAHSFDWLWKSCKNLKKLQLRECQTIGIDVSVSSFVNCLKGLQEVELTTCVPIVDDILSKLAENCASLSSLLVDYGGSGEGLHHFITQSRFNLRKLDLELLNELEDNHLLAVAEKFRGLLSLRLDSCYLVTGEGLKTMASAMSNKLEELALIDCNVEPGLLTTLGQRFRNLRKLDLSYNDKLVDEEFISMLASFNCLRELYVRGCNGLTNASVVSMFKSCKQLESVDLMDCRGTEAKVVELFDLNCPQLRQIRIEESKLSDISRSWASKKFIEVIID
ncbi:hypothetical protein RHGRI_022800 [Rhododendron griersonianum]|uniref:RNI-like protein n=1 Tax=Rhododendron griersonianum TaxID=479676 RepID=A0AAV6J3G5_9ERIC|nr:hypothetical protein RHGRI_022800 [Rhododendron griersonianum]